MTGLESQLGRSLLDAGLQRLVDVIEVAGHLVETLFEDAQLPGRDRRHAGRQLALGHCPHRVDKAHHRSREIVGDGNGQCGENDHTDEDDHQAADQQVVLACDQDALVELDENVADDFLSDRFVRGQWLVEQGVAFAHRAEHRCAVGQPGFGFGHQAGFVELLAQGLTGHRHPAADRQCAAALVDDDRGLDACFLVGRQRQRVQIVELAGDDAVFADRRQVARRGQALCVQFGLQATDAADRKVNNQRNADEQAGQERQNQQAVAQGEVIHRPPSVSRRCRRLASSATFRPRA